jgi:hypothetical protein
MRGLREKIEIAPNLRRSVGSIASETSCGSEALDACDMIEAREWFACLTNERG